MYTLFTDGSVNPQLKIGYGAYLIIQDLVIKDGLSESLSHQSLSNQIQTKLFENTSSSRLEVETLIWALQTLLNRESSNIHQNHPLKVSIYTDSQMIMGLPKRRTYLEKTMYHNQKQTVIKNKAQYQHFFALIDQLECHFIKVKGHKKADQKEEIDVLFSYVDRAARKALRTHLKSNYSQRIHKEYTKDKLNLNSV